MRTLPAAEQQPQCEHVALVHRGPDDLARSLAPHLQRAAAEGAAVLLCLDDVAEARVRAEVGSVCDSFEFGRADSRYATPGKAMDALHRFMSNASSVGASTAWSIGAIPLGGDGRDHRWLRYEEAVLEIFADQPLRAVCLYDAMSTPHDVRAGVERTHQSLSGVWDENAHGDAGSTASMVTQVFPSRPPDLVLHEPTPRDARASFRARFGAVLSAAAVNDLELACSELTTNAAVHGAPPVQLRVWNELTACIVQVSDAGTGSIDRFADLRSCLGGSHGGFGLWTIGQLAHSVDISRQFNMNVVTVSVVNL